MFGQVTNSTFDSLTLMSIHFIFVPKTVNLVKFS